MLLSMERCRSVPFFHYSALLLNTLDSVVSSRSFFRTTLTLAVLLILMAAFPQSPAAEADTRDTATGTIRTLLETIHGTDNRSIGAVPEPGQAVIDDVFPVHDPVSGDVAYIMVPVSAGGRVSGVVTVDPTGERWLWCSFNYNDPSFPPVPESDARARAEGRARSIGVAAPTGSATLVQGGDKQVYWQFDTSDGENWLVDMDRRETPVLGSFDQSSRDALARRPDLHANANGLVPETPIRNPENRKAGAARVIPDTYNIPGVPYHHQITSWYCGLAALQMVMDYTGEEIEQTPMSDVANDITNDGVYSSDLVRAAHFSGMSVAIQDSSLWGYDPRKLGYASHSTSGWCSSAPYTEIKEVVCTHTPVLVLTWYGASHTAGHYRVVKGYDDNMGAFIVHDPWYDSPFYGPDVLFEQGFFVTDLWAYSGRWAMITNPWLLTPEVPTGIAIGDTFDIDLTVLYPGIVHFSPDYSSNGLALTCSATVSLPPGLVLNGSDVSQHLSDLFISGESESVSWSVIATGGSGEYDISFGARGIVTSSSYSYTTYSDSIGGHAGATVEVATRELAGWESETRLTNDVASSQTCFPGGRAMVTGEDGKIHIVWAETRDGNSEIYYRARTGDTWGAETRLTNDTCYSDSPALAVDEAGDIHIAWVDTRNDNMEIYYKCLHDTGWTTDERVTDHTRPDRGPSIAAGGDGVYIAWDRAYSSNSKSYEVFFSALSDTGWSDPETPDNAAVMESYRPSLAWGTDNLLHIVYEREGGTPEREKIRHRSWDGASWSGATVLANDASYSRNPVIAAGPDSTLHVVWQDGENTGGDIFYALYNGSAWQTTEHLVTGTDEATTPTVTAGNDGQVHVAWTDHRHGQTEIFLVSHDGVGWGDESRLSTGDGSSILPALSTSLGGATSVLWTDLRDGNAEIYFRCKDVDTRVAGGEGYIPASSRSAVLSPMRPAPFRSETRFSFTLPLEGNVCVAVYDLAGRHVRTITDAHYSSGSHDALWDGRNGAGRDVANGIYFVRCTTQRGSDVRRVVRLR